MTQSVRHNNARRPHQASLMTLVGTDHRITPIPPVGTEIRPVSTFEQFVQIFNGHKDSETVQAMVNGDITPKTSNMSLIGLLASSLAGVTGLITVSRRGLFRRTAR